MNQQKVRTHILQHRRKSASVINLSDYRLERDISALHSRLIAASDRLEQRLAAARLCCLVGLRSPEQVARMDMDNCIKITLDALNGVAYVDDSQVVRLQACKNIGQARAAEGGLFASLDEAT